MGPDQVDLSRLRREYADAGLDEAHVGDEPWSVFRRWLADAVAAGVHEPNAMVLSTVSAAGRVSSRMVLLKGFDEHGLRFFTNQASHKGSDLAATSSCSLLFPWHPLERQVRVEGQADPLSADEVEAYFRLRPRGAQIGAWASRQSQAVESRAALDRAYASFEEKFADQEVPVPPTWGGYRVRPDVVEFWQGRPGRMHDRLRYVLEGDRWRRSRLAP